MSSAYENEMSDLAANNYTQPYPPAPWWENEVSGRPATQVEGELALALVKEMDKREALDQRRIDLLSDLNNARREADELTAENNQLQASMQELLAACEFALPLLIDLANSSNNETENKAAYLMEAAIAKASGR